MTGALAIPLFAVALLLVHAVVPGSLPLEIRVLGALPGIAAAILWRRYFASKEFDRFPFLAYAATQFYVYWTLVILTLGPEEIASAGVRRSAWAGGVAGACLVTAAVLLAHPGGVRLGARAGRVLEACLPRSAPGLSMLIVVPWLALAVVTQARLGGGVIPEDVSYLVNTLGDYAPLLAAIAWRDRLAGRRSLLFSLCTATLAFAGLLTGMLEAVVRPVLTAFALYVVLWGRIPWRLVATGALLIVLLNPAKHVYREMAWTDDGSPQSRVASDPVLAAQQWWTALEEAWTSGDSRAEENAEGLAARFDELRINATVIEKTPSFIPFDRGRSWKYVVLFPVPRFVHPDKPNFTNVYNDRFNVLFGFQTVEGTELSTGAFPLVADGYWNFGWPGVLLVGLVTGCIVGSFGGAFRARSWAITSIGVSTFVNLHATSCVALQVMGVFQRVTGMAAMLWIVWLASRALESRWRSNPAFTMGEA